MSARVMKVLRDAYAARGRLLLLGAALAAGVAAVALIATAYAILGRELPQNYAATHPAAAQLELDGVDDALLAAVRARSEVASAESAAALAGRIQVEADRWMPLRLFVVPDFAQWRLNTVAPEIGAWPPAAGSLWLERTALPLTRHALGERVALEIGGAALTLPIAGTVHDAGVAPAWQEQTVYGYVDGAALRALGARAAPNLIKLTFRSGDDDVHAIETQARELASWLAVQGHPVHEIRIPPPGRHPHQGQMNAVLSMLQIFSLLALLLGSVLAASTLGAWLAQQVRQIAVMKAIGASPWQIASGYAVLVCGIAALSTVAGLALGLHAGRSLAVAVAALLNLRLNSFALSPALLAALFALDCLLPLLAAAPPIASAARRTIRAALDDHGINRSKIGMLDRALTRIPALGAVLTLALRNAFRRRGRLVWTLALLASAGAMFITAANLRAAWQRDVADAASDRHYAFELRLAHTVPERDLFDAIRADADVAAVEAWNIAVAAPDSGAVELTHTYPDGSHGGLALRSVPADMQLVSRRMRAGRWLAPDDVDAVVLNGLASAAFPDAGPGDRIALRVDGRALRLRVVGIVREELTPAAAYVSMRTYASLTPDAEQANAVRVALRGGTDTDAALRRVVRALEQRGDAVNLAITEREFGAAQAGHVYILIFSLLLIAAAMSAVATLGLASALGTAVLERTREFGVLRAIGATPADILRGVLAEGAFIGVLSTLLAVLLAWPLSFVLGRVLGAISRIPLLPTLAWPGVLLWIALATGAALLASTFPARRAAALAVREALSFN